MAVTERARYTFPLCESAPELPKLRLVPPSTSHFKAGDKVWLLMAVCEEYPGESGAVDPSSFEWVPATVREVSPDSLTEVAGAWLTFADGSHAWYEDRFIKTESAAKVARLPAWF